MIATRTHRGVVQPRGSEPTPPSLPPSSRSRYLRSRAAINEPPVANYFIATALSAQRPPLPVPGRRDKRPLPSCRRSGESTLSTVSAFSNRKPAGAIADPRLLCLIWLNQFCLRASRHVKVSESRGRMIPVFFRDQGLWQASEIRADSKDI